MNDAPKSKRETFTAEIGVTGNSLAIRITAQAGRMGVQRGDLVQVTLERIE